MISFQRSKLHLVTLDKHLSFTPFVLSEVFDIVLFTIVEVNAL